MKSLDASEVETRPKGFESTGRGLRIHISRSKGEANVFSFVV